MATATSSRFRSAPGGGCGFWWFLAAMLAASYVAFGTTVQTTKVGGDDITGNTQVLTGVSVEESDPTVPAWAKQPEPPGGDADFTTNNTVLVETIEAVAPTPGDYAAVSNAAMNAVSVSAITNGFTEWVVVPAGPSIRWGDVGFGSWEFVGDGWVEYAWTDANVRDATSLWTMHDGVRYDATRVRIVSYGNITDIVCGIVTNTVLTDEWTFSGLPDDATNISLEYVDAAASWILHWEEEGSFRERFSSDGRNATYINFGDGITATRATRNALGLARYEDLAAATNNIPRPDLSEYAKTNDVQLTPAFTPWLISPSLPEATVFWLDRGDGETAHWAVDDSGYLIEPDPWITDPHAIRFTFVDDRSNNSYTAARGMGYVLGSQTNKVLASTNDLVKSQTLTNYYTIAETDDAIDALAAYYITINAEGDAFPTYAALTNTSVYYSGGEPRTPTRNDYAVVLADETHGSNEWRYIYAVSVVGGVTNRQWEAQYPIETNDYEGLSNKPQIGGIELVGNKSASDLGLLPITAISATDETFSNAVLQVGIGIDTNTVAAINALVEAGDELPIGGATTVGGLLLALAAAIAALKRGKAGASALRYDLVTKTIANNAATLDDRAINIVIIDASVTSVTFTFPARTNGKARDFFIRLVIQGTTPPTIRFVEPGGGAVSFDSADDQWAAIDVGVNIIMFIDTAE